MKSPFALLALSLSVPMLAWADIPHLRPQGAATRLVVHDAPFLILGGELGNSSGESGYLAPYWDKMAVLNLNTLLLPVSWNLVEPVEGQYDWSTLDGMIRDARANDIHLVLLWFGAWKNSMSCYAPDWVKADTARFPRCLSSGGRPLEIVTPLSDEALRCDSRVFSAMMKHLRETDSEQNTVIMVQVENEIGMVGDARDHSALADAEFVKAVPAGLISYLNDHFDALHPTLRARWLEHGRKTSGTWAEVFGTDLQAEEIFMAWEFAAYTGKVAS
ncbi:MAG: beta-galactosidase, partial [Opitutales bacterium]